MVTDGDAINTDAFQRGHLPELQASELIFAFTGQGAQWPGMARSLIDAYSQFSNDLQIMDGTLKGLPIPPKWLLHGILFPFTNRKHGDVLTDCRYPDERRPDYNGPC